MACIQGQDIIKLLTFVLRQGHSFVKTFFSLSEYVPVTSSYFMSASLICAKACQHSHGG